MIPFASPLLHAAAGGGGGDGYAAFEAYITALATRPETAWGSAFTPTPGDFITKAGAETGSMVGSPWGGYFRTVGASACRIVQHALPSQAVFNEQIASGQKVFISIATAGSQLLPGLDRNGYTSISETDTPLSAATSNRCLYWSNGSAWEINPVAATPPTPFTGYL